MTRDTLAGSGCSTKQPHRYTVARFALERATGQQSLPSVTETLPLAEQVRHALLFRCQQIVRRRDASLADADIWPLSPAFWGKDEQGRPLTGHVHAFFLPTDEDSDGQLDHITVFAPMGLNALERQALDMLRQFSFDGGEPLPLLLIGLGSERDFRALLLEESTVWLSATPFVATRYPKLRGQKRDRPEDYTSPCTFARHIIQEELQRRQQLPEVLLIEDQEVIGMHGLRPGQFQRCRRKAGDDGDRRPAGAFRITFSAPVHGPLCLGHASHFGLGLFLPSSAGVPRAAR